ncbi:alpha/beta hydrolase [Bradyrhizobium sp. WYCCWR 13023]|uniref:Alpha/beta hydrolase n=1 Tax=Bradyrhizobium zhengyangense TaxID=2911009 RepID=A0A9X1UFB0_9BRAD|nr:MULTISPECIES: alpha/beta hydrolase [Bradyrhizobium]MCG2626282.1 alpha/beta hydrolase [Bradyrhizobium zhengyangense]MCG2644706.1 alpha/beta hydrolase [Bradyrhizobium zhengyangense]MCG2668290.1 alpha/beta hydrolase [Bradyrhizobium zhengyangense]MDA9521310.1 hypothetical protein [Bradyrhizobium sp. CCBAU 11434]
MSAITERKDDQSGAGFRTARVETPSGGVYARDYAGTGPAFVMMHGFPDNLHIYDDLVPRLTRAGRRVVTFDFLGFGASDKSQEGGYSFAQQLSNLEAVVSHLALESAMPVAHDSSGPAALNFALKDPKRTAAVVVLNSFYCEAPTLRYPEFIELFASKSLNKLSETIRRSPEQFAWVLNFQRAAFQAELSEQHRAHYSSVLGPIIDANFREQPSAARAFAQMTAGLFEEVQRNTQRLPALSSMTVPVRLIWGDRDPYLNLGVAEHLASALKYGELVSLPAGHWVQMDEPGAVARGMLRPF